MVGFFPFLDKANKYQYILFKFKCAIFALTLVKYQVQFLESGAIICCRVNYIVAVFQMALVTEFIGESLLSPLSPRLKIPELGKISKVIVSVYCKILDNTIILNKTKIFTVLISFVKHSTTSFFLSIQIFKEKLWQTKKYSIFLTHIVIPQPMVGIIGSKRTIIQSFL